MKIFSFFILGGLLLSSCVGTKYLKKGEYILYKQHIKSSGRINKEEISDQLAQRPNSKLPIIPISLSVYAYQWGENAYDTAKISRQRKRIASKFNYKIEKTGNQTRINRLISKKAQKLEEKDKKIKEGNLFMRWGEPLAIFDSIKVETTVQNMKNYLFTEGYFNSIVKSTITYKGKRAIVDYAIFERNPYYIDSLIYNISDQKVSKIFYENLEQQKLKDKQYNQSLFSEERDRLNDLMTNNGYYNFKRQYVLFEVDSTLLGDQKLTVRQTIANPPDKKNHRTYRLDSVVFSNEARAQRRVTNYDNITFLLDNKKYPEKQLSWRIFLEKDSLYSKNLTLESQKQLAYLDIFKFVNVNYDTTGGNFIATIFTSPLKKFQTSWEAGLSIIEKQQNLPGPFFNVNAKSRNTFGSLEIIQLDGNSSIQGIQSVSEQTNNYSRFQYGGELSITYPQFLFPIKNSVKSKIGRYNPRTKIATGVNFEDRINEYRRTTFNANMSYIWQIKDNSQFTLKPFDVSYIYSDNFGQFKSDLDSLELSGNRSLVSAFKSSFVTFSSFNFNFNNNNYGLGRNTGSLLQGHVETGGNVLNTPVENWFPQDSLEYYKYIKASLDYRKTRRLNTKSQLAFRVNAGAAYTSPENPALPYEKYFFAGGSNSVRAWKPRRLGPGAYASYLTNQETQDIIINDQREQPGDIIFESSIEYRHDLVGFIDYAIFIDAGNVWLWKSETVDKNSDGFGTGTNDDGVFRLKTFPREIALGSGFGLRFDFSFLVLRVDLAYKVVDPAYPIGERFILNTYKFSDLWNLSDKAALNIGIGYPF